MNNLFVNLKKYCGEKSTRREEFFTQLVVYILNSDSKLSEEFIRFLLPVNLIKEINFKNIKIEPECYEIGIGRFDIKIEIDEDYIIIIENKLGAKFTKRSKIETQDEKLKEKKILQLLNYATWLSKQKHKNKFLVLITHPYYEYFSAEKTLKENEKDKEVKFRHIPWTEFHYFISNYTKNKLKENKNFSKKKNGFLIQELINYMEEENMKSWEPITKEDDNKLKGLVKTYHNFDLIIQDISSIFAKYIKKNINKQINNVAAIEEQFPIVYCQINLNDNWSLGWGFQSTFNDKQWAFSFFIEVSTNKNGRKLIEKSQKEFEEINFKPEIDQEGNKFFRKFFNLDENFFNKYRSYGGQKKEFTNFTEKAIKELKDIQIVRQYFN